MSNIHERFDLAYTGLYNMMDIYQNKHEPSNQVMHNYPVFTFAMRALGNAASGYNLSMNTNVKVKVDKILDYKYGYFMTYTTDPENISLALDLEYIPDDNFNKIPLFIAHRHLFDKTKYDGSDEDKELSDFKAAEIVVLANQVLNDNETNILDAMQYIMPSSGARITPYYDYISAYISTLFIIQSLRKIYPDAYPNQICYVLADIILKKTGNYTKESVEELQKVWHTMFIDVFDCKSIGEVFRKIQYGEFPLLLS